MSLLDPRQIIPNEASLAIYGDPSHDLDDLLASIRDVGILEPLVVAENGGHFRLISGHRRLESARVLGLSVEPCRLAQELEESGILKLILAHNRHRRKTFSMMMREADAVEEL